MNTLVYVPSVTAGAVHATLPVPLGPGLGVGVVWAENVGLGAAVGVTEARGVGVTLPVAVGVVETPGAGVTRWSGRRSTVSFAQPAASAITLSSKKLRACNVKAVTSPNVAPYARLPENAARYLPLETGASKALGGSPPKWYVSARRPAYAALFCVRADRTALGASGESTPT